MILWPHRWVDDQIIYLTDEEIAAAKAGDAACTERKAALALLPKPPTDAERIAELSARLTAVEAKQL